MWDTSMPTVRVLPTGNTLQGRTSVGVYFCADWCGPCTSFTPILKNYYTAERASRAERKESTLEIVLVSRCRTARETENLFSTMPWTAMPHVDSVGTRGNDMMATFGVTTIPALVFLDGTGTITCLNGRDEVARQQAATHRSATISRPLPLPQAEATDRPVSVLRSKTGSRVKVRPQVGPAPEAERPVRAPVQDCDLPAMARGDLPPDTRSASLRAPRPPGPPPAFPTTAGSSVLTARNRRAQQAAAGRPHGAATLTQEAAAESPAPTPRPPRRSDRKRPPPKPNLECEGKRARVWFAEEPAISDKPGRRRQGPDSRTAYHLTAAQIALIAKAALGGGGSATRAPAPPSTQNHDRTVQQEPDRGIISQSDGPTDPTQGKPRSLMQPQPLAEVHPFTPVMHEWRHGIAVDCGPDWEWDVIEAAIERGPHPTARTPDAIELFREDIAYQVNAGFCQVMLWEDVKRLRPANLKISPVALIPQVDRRGRIILDLSFPVYQEVNGVITVTQQSVNDSTVLTAPSIPVKEIGKVLPRLLQYMRDTPPGLHILFSKLDISDGFWRLVVKEEDCFNFAYVLPQAAGEPTRLVVPAAVQMGWVESPSLFCTVTESARDLAQHFVDATVDLPHDPVEDKMSIEDVPMRARTDAPSKLLQVYVDDFCYAATQSQDGAHIPTIRRAAVHGIHSYFPSPKITKHEGGKEPISEKKLKQGDGNFVSRKDMIGFEFDGIRRTVRLPAEKAKAYIKEVHRVLRRKSVPLKTLQMLVGKLRHASVILPAAKGFFTPINAAMRGSPKRIGLGATSDVRAALQDIVSLLHMLSSRPTHAKELVPDMPQYAGYHDAAAEGAGGVWFSLASPMQPIVWREAFPEDIASNVVSDDNPNGGITNSDLELAAEVLAIGVILDKAPCIKHVPLGTLCDNTPTVSWVEKMASKAKTPTAGRLLRGLAFMLHWQHAGRLTTVHVPGTDNVMADIASRPSKALALFHASTALTDTAFCSEFDSLFPLPDDQLWALAQTPRWVRSNVYETLRGKRLQLPLWTGPNAKSGGQPGRTTTKRTTPAAILTPRTPQRTSSSRLLLPCGKVSTDSEIKSRFSRSKKLSGTSPKSSFWTDIQTPEEPPRPNSHLTFPLHV